MILGWMLATGGRSAERTGGRRVDRREDVVAEGLSDVGPRQLQRGAALDELIFLEPACREHAATGRAGLTSIPPLIGDGVGVSLERRTSRRHRARGDCGVRSGVQIERNREQVRATQTALEPRGAAGTPGSLRLGAGRSQVRMSSAPGPEPGGRRLGHARALRCLFGGHGCVAESPGQRAVRSDLQLDRFDVVGPAGILIQHSGAVPGSDSARSSAPRDRRERGGSRPDPAATRRGRRPVCARPGQPRRDCGAAAAYSLTVPSDRADAARRLLSG